jgi:steroid delta-isomerase
MTSPNSGETARLAMAAVQRGAREDWLALFAADASLEDPVGAAPMRTGTTEIEDFWDTSVAALEHVSFEVRRVHEAPGEAVVLADVSIRAPGGASAAYDAAIHYRVDDAGRITALRAFWDLTTVMEQLAAG